MIITILSPFDLVLAILPLYAPYFFGKFCISFVYLVVEGFFVISQSFFPRGRADTFVLFRSVITKIARDLCRVQDVLVKTIIVHRTLDIPWTAACFSARFFFIDDFLKNLLVVLVNFRHHILEARVAHFHRISVKICDVAGNASLEV